MDFLAVLATLAIVSLIDKDKGGFLSEDSIHFSNPPQKIFQITILNLKFEIPAHISKQLQISSSG